MVRTHGGWLADMDIGGLSDFERRSFPEALRFVNRLREHGEMQRHWWQRWAPTMVMGVVGIATIVAQWLHP